MCIQDGIEEDGLASKEVNDTDSEETYVIRKHTSKNKFYSCRQFTFCCENRCYQRKTYIKCATDETDVFSCDCAKKNTEESNKVRFFSILINFLIQHKFSALRLSGHCSEHIRMVDL